MSARLAERDKVVQPAGIGDKSSPSDILRIGSNLSVEGDADRRALFVGLYDEVDIFRVEAKFEEGLP